MGAGGVPKLVERFPGCDLEGYELSQAQQDVDC